MKIPVLVASLFGGEMFFNGSHYHGCEMLLMLRERDDDVTDLMLS